MPTRRSDFCIPCMHPTCFCLQMMSKHAKTDTSAAFMRKGQTGGWKKHLTPEMVKRFEMWEAKWLEGSDLQFEYQLGSNNENILI
jgi:hypothetical protein